VTHHHDRLPGGIAASSRGLLSAAAAVGAAPIVLTFLIAQKAIISGLTGVPVKG